MSLDLLRAIEEPPTGEVPIQVSRQDHAYEVPGGMAAVARNLLRLSARVRIAAIVGAETAAAELRDGLAEVRVDPSGLLTAPSVARP